jgi:membrane-associated phospholipid phosphatase
MCVRAGAAAALAGAAVVPLVRRRYRVPGAVTLAATASGPFALAILRPRTRARDAAVFALQMWAFTIVHELPYDDPDGLRRRLRVRYPVAIDRAIGLGELPSIRLQRAFSAPGAVTKRDRFLTFAHWAWFFQPHLSLVWILARRTDRFPRAARQMAAVYDLGCLIYYLVPTAPPWWAGEAGHIDGEVRRVMVEVGEDVWGPAWPPLYETLGGNPWAAMPSLHFATSLLAALLLSESGRAPGALGWGYALTLGFALVYLCEHYVVDLIAGAALVALVRRGEPIAEPWALAVSRGVQRLERIANG